MNERISAVRKSAGLTQEEFAAAIGLSKNFIWMIEKGDRTPSDRTIADICREFGISEHWLRTGEGEMQIQVSEDDELTQIFMEIGASDDELAKAAIRMYWHLSEKEKWLTTFWLNFKKEKAPANDRGGESIFVRIQFFQ